MEELVEMEIKGLTLDPVTNMPIVILKDVHGERSLPIWIGLFEANAIALEMEKVETPRPMTHDLMVRIINSLGAVVARVVVHDLKDNTFFAKLVVTREGEDVEIDSRPSDAIALALRTGAPVFVSGEVLGRSQTFEAGEEMSDSEKVKEWLEKLKPDDFGKYQV